jgi:hypothetical protein
MSGAKYIFLVFVWSYHSKRAVYADAIQIMSIIYTEGGVGFSIQAWMPTYVSILRFPHMI